MATPIRNFEQLIVVKQLYQDARDLSQRGDRLSLTKSIILLDLAVEQSLKSILLNLNPNFIIPRGRNDISWKDLWRNASSAVQNTKGVSLSEQNESSRLVGRNRSRTRQTQHLSPASRATISQETRSPGLSRRFGTRSPGATICRRSATC